MGCTHSKYEVSEKELITIDQLEKELFRFQKNIRGYRRRKMICLKRIKSRKSPSSTPSSHRSLAAEQQIDGTPSCDKNISNIKQDFNVPQREPANASSSHHVVMPSQKSVQPIPEDKQICQSYNPIQNYEVIRQISNIKQDSNVPQREPANASSSHHVAMPSQQNVQPIPEDKQICQSYNPIQNYEVIRQISNIKQDFDVPQREPANASSSHHVVMPSQQNVQPIPEGEQICQSYNPIQNYEVIRQIGAGAFGQVYLAEHKSQDGQFAIKTIPLGFSQTMNLAKEVEILRKCNHRNILRLQESFCCNAHLCIVTEYVPGWDLYTISTVAQGFLINESLVSFFMRECLQGLAYLHHQKIIHCDFKSANILVGMNGQVKIADFGLSEREDEQLIPGFRGTTLYAAPEMANGLAFDNKVDIWGLGVVAIEMLQGYAPLQYARTDEDAFSWCRYGYNTMNHQTASMASGVLMDFLYNGALIQNPEDRFTANELLRHPFITSPVHICGNNCMCLSTLLGWVMTQQTYRPQGGNG